jgi:hypothetical protein
MKKKAFRFTALALCFAAMLSCGEKGKADPDSEEEKKDTRPVYKVSAEVNPFTWIAIDGQGNTIDPDKSGYKDASKRTKKQVGIFYFLWHGCHGYDRGANYNECMLLLLPTPRVPTTFRNFWMQIQQPLRSAEAV